VKHPQRNLSPMTSLTMGLFGVDAIVPARILMSDLGHRGKETAWRSWRPSPSLILYSSSTCGGDTPY